MASSVQRFLEDNEALLRTLANRFQTHYKRPTQEKIAAYLAQFQAAEEARYILKLLQKVDYIDDARISDMFREFYFQKLSGEEQRKAIFTVIGGPQDSSSMINYLCSKALTEREKKDRIFGNLTEIIASRDPEDSVIVFCDDLLASGTQSVTIFKEWLGAEKNKNPYVTPLNTKEIDWLKHTKLIYFVLIGFEEGIDKLRTELGRHNIDISISPSKKMREDQGCFKPGSLIFDDEAERRGAEQMAREIGYQLFADKRWDERLKRERALGYGDSQKLIVFFYNTPPCTLPLLWKEGTYRGQTWVPLFPRREQERSAEQTPNPKEQEGFIRVGSYPEDVTFENPYNISSPAKKYFRGREAELQRLVATLKEGKSAVVFGLQRIGKTSLIEKLLDEEIQRPAFPRKIIPLRIDMFSAWKSFNSDIDFIFTISDELAAHLGADDAKRKKALRDFWLDSSTDVERQKKFKTILQQGASRTKSSLLLFIDEFHDIQRVFERAKIRKTPNPVDAGLIRWIGSFVKDSTLQLLICCRYKAIPMERQEKLELFKLLEEINLGVLDAESARALIRDPVGRTVKYEELSVRKILELTGGHPYLIQYFCSELMTIPRIKRWRIVRLRDVEECIEDIVSDPIRESKFHILYEDFQEMDAGFPWRTLLSLAENSETSGGLVPRDHIVATYRERFSTKGDERNIRSALDTLVLSQIVSEEKWGRTPSYCIRPDMLRMWLRERRYIDKMS